MRLSEVERGEGLFNRSLIALISRASGMRLPDAARVAFYHKDFFGGPLGAWAQAALRGPSAWSIGERELMAAMVAKWNTCPFCVGAHGAIAAKKISRERVDAALADHRAAGLTPGLTATLGFLEKQTRDANGLRPEDAREVLRAGVTREALTDAAAVGAVFNIVTRYANALDFAMPTPDEFDRAGDMLLKRGYGS